jgi:hypothetical protein
MVERERKLRELRANMQLERDELETRQKMEREQASHGVEAATEDYNKIKANWTAAKGAAKDYYADLMKSADRTLKQAIAAEATLGPKHERESALAKQQIHKEFIDKMNQLDDEASHLAAMKMGDSSNKFHPGFINFAALNLGRGLVMPRMSRDFEAFENAMKPPAAAAEAGPAAVNAWWRNSLNTAVYPGNPGKDYRVPYSGAGGRNFNQFGYLPWPGSGLPEDKYLKRDSETPLFTTDPQLKALVIQILDAMLH